MTPQDLASLLLFAAAVGFFALMIFLVRLLNRTRRVEFPFAAKSVFTDSERLFFHVLRTCAPPGTMLLAKVRLADFLDVRGAPSNEYLRHFGRISQKHTDFLLVDADRGGPMLAIELDDATHRTNARTRESDAFKQAAYAAAGVPLLRVPLARKYDAHGLRDVIHRAIEDERRRAEATRNN